MRSTWEDSKRGSALLKFLFSFVFTVREKNYDSMWGSRLNALMAEKNQRLVLCWSFLCLFMIKEQIQAKQTTSWNQVLESILEKDRELDLQRSNFGLDSYLLLIRSENSRTRLWWRKMKAIFTWLLNKWFVFHPPNVLLHSGNCSCISWSTEKESAKYVSC